MNKLHGLILKKSDYIDDGNIIYLLTDNSVNLIIFSKTEKLNNKNRPFLHPCNEVIVDYIGNSTDFFINKGISLHLITEKFYLLHSDNNYLLIWNMICKIIIVNNDNGININKNIYFLLKELIIFFENKNTNYRAIYIYFILWLLYLLKINFVLDRCVNCESNKNIIQLNLNSGGLLCKNCVNTKKIDNFIYIKNFINIYKDKEYINIEETIKCNNYFFTWINNMLTNYFELNFGVNNIKL